MIEADGLNTAHYIRLRLLKQAGTKKTACTKVMAGEPHG
jgi:hypothetical protein